MFDRIKKLVEALGLIPAILALFKVTPHWFTPSEFYAVDFYFFAAIAAFLAFVTCWICLNTVYGPPSTWTANDRKRYFKYAVVEAIGVVGAGLGYLFLVRGYPYSSGLVDAAQIVLWAGVFVLGTIAMTTLASLAKSTVVPPGVAAGPI